MDHKARSPAFGGCDILSSGWISPSVTLALNGSGGVLAVSNAGLSRVLARKHLVQRTHGRRSAQGLQVRARVAGAFSR
eukprot:scaffold304889_cov23-Tisochrysis_lutea.AAC.2